MYMYICIYGRMPLAPAFENLTSPLCPGGGKLLAFCRGGAGPVRIGSVRRPSDQVETLFVQINVDIYFYNGPMGPRIRSE